MKNKYIIKLFKIKDRFHKKLAKIPIKEKIKILIKLQKIVKPIKEDIFVWKI